MLKIFLENIYDAFIQKTCLSCNEHTHALPFCNFCQDSVEILKDSNNQALFSYSGAIREAFKQAKFKPDETAARQIFSLVHISTLPVEKYLRSQKFDFITFVPLHKKRLLKRQFDLASIFAKILAKKFNLPLKDLLTCQKYTEPLTLALTREERLQRAHNKYKLKNLKLYSREFKNRKILLLDDITTTGSTLESAAQVLEIHNNKIYQLAFAQTPLV